MISTKQFDLGGVLRIKYLAQILSPKIYPNSLMIETTPHDPVCAREDRFPSETSPMTHHGHHDYMGGEFPLSPQLV